MNLDTISTADIFDLCATVDAASVDMILCDLPYGTTACSWDTVIPFDPMWAAFKRLIKLRGAIVLMASQPFTSQLVCSNLKMFRYEWVQDKAIATLFLDANHKPLKAHDNICVFAQKTPNYYPQMIKGEKHIRNAPATHSQVYGEADARSASASEWYYPRSIIRFPNERGLHPTQKPVALFEYLIRTYTQPGELVFDPCVGSGTTALAARNCGRHWICGDSAEEYIKIAVDRLQNTDPFQDRKIEASITQHSLFAEQTS